MFRCQNSLSQLDGPKWREKLPALPTVSRSDLPPVTSPTSAVQKTPAEVDQKQENKRQFEKFKTEGNDFVKKVI